MKKTTQALLTFFVLSATRHSLAGDLPPSGIAWPAGSQEIIARAISIKKSAQRLNMTMRTQNGSAGISFVKCMDDLADALVGTEIEPKLLDAEGRDLNAKIALLALDRKRRPEAYSQIADFHVNAPETYEALSRFYRRGKPGPDVLPGAMPRLLHPHRVSKEDAVEANRWIFEYFYFAPPTGREFVEITARYELGRALGEIGNEKSLVLLRFDLEAQTEAFPNALPGQGCGAMIGGESVVVLAFGTPEAFKITASLLFHAGVRKHIKTRLDSYLSTPPGYITLDERRKLDIYRNLADMDWHTHSEKELASWIKAVPIIPPAAVQKR
ncbi:MAG: hypothetical protein NTY61_00430 [Candidatus Parcubacteria bacterium]|nr:hypothetical protein [Candidatus Parcubacteria bacterium]